MSDTAEKGRLLARARAIRMLDSLDRVGATPVRDRDFHVFAYFVNVLSPLWDVVPLEGSVLKDEAGPFFPELQEAVDFLIYGGVAYVSSLDVQGNRLSITIGLNHELHTSLIEAISTLPDEENISDFLDELAFAFTEILPDERDNVATQDAAWSDPKVDSGRVIDFGEWVDSVGRNPAWNVTQQLQEFAPPGVVLARSEKLLMYMRLLQKRSHG